MLIEQRSGEVRNMLQLEELLSLCNAPGPQDSDLSFSCRPFTFTGDLKRCTASLCPQAPGVEDEGICVSMSSGKLS